MVLQMVFGEAEIYSPMKNIFFFLIFSLPGYAMGQGYFDLTKREWIGKGIGIALAGVSGVADGYHHLLTNRYSEFKRRHSGANDDFWDRTISWKRKYRNWPEDTRAAYIGSKTWLAWTTDGWHLTDMLARSTFTVGLTCSFLLGNEGAPWWHYVLDAVLLSMARNVAFELTHR